ncbi:nuclear pore complex protein NUP1-like [Aristolochia californica]|uniref:nuclear pore complex protein NUP1-like n=1 Tax=Aristolochia californica TaxID=171875 RepID=UPI0035DA3E6E
MTSVGGGEEAGASYQGRGVGGKLQLRSHRRAPSTPYDRPAARRKDGWLSKFVDPASRLATRFFPTLFSKPEDSLPIDDPGHEPSREDGRYIPDNNVSVSVEKGNLTQVDVANDSPSRTDLDKKNVVGSISEIEQFLQQKMFSRDEFIQLTELLRSRTVDLSTDHEHTRKDLDVGFLVADGSKDSLHQAEFRMPLPEKLAQPLNYRAEKASSSLLQSAEHDDTGSSPVEIAKAFMGNRKSEPASASQNVMFKESKSPTGDSVSRLPLPPPSLESPVCWPGAVIQDVPGYLTPQAQRGRIGLHNLPRTPYSRPSQFQGVGEKPLNLSSIHLRQQQTPIFGSHQVTKKRNYRVDDGFATVGPVRRTNQLSTDTYTPKRDSFSHAIRSATSLRSNLNTFSPSSDVLENEPCSTLERSRFMKPSAATKSASVHPQSSKMAQKILEHLDRAVPSPKEKLAELNSVLARRKATTNSLPDIPIHQPNEGGYQEKGPLFFNPEGQNSERASGLGVTDISTSKVGTSAVSSESFNTSFDMEPSGAFKEVHGLQTSSHEDVERLTNDRLDDKNQLSFCQNQSDAHQMQRPLSFSKRPTLKSISIVKRDGMQTVSSDSAFGFTFPVSLASGGAAVCEPPTPTIVPAFSASKPSQTKEASAIPSFSFTSSSTKKGLNFSLASNLSSSVLDTSVPKFSFGSENNKDKISFSAAGAAFAALTNETLAEPNT